MKRLIYSTCCLLGIACLTFTACKKPKPGINQPPVKTTVLIYQPTWGMSIKNTVTDVPFRTKIKVKTMDNSYNIINYPGSPLIDFQSAPSGSPFITYGKEYKLDQPQGATKIQLDIEVENTQCGWPVPNESWPGGSVLWEYQGPITDYPANMVVQKHYFNVIYKSPC